MKIASNVMAVDFTIEYRNICTTKSDVCAFYVRVAGAGPALFMVRESEDYGIEHPVDSFVSGVQITNVDSYDEDAYVWFYREGELLLRCARIDETNAVDLQLTSIDWLRFINSTPICDGKFILFRWYDDYAGVTISDQSVIVYEHYGNSREDVSQPETPTAYSSDKGSAWQTPVRCDNRYYFCCNAFTAGATGYQWGNYYFLTGKIDPNGRLNLSWEKFSYAGELTQAQKEFKKVMRFHMMTHGSITYLWVGVVVEDYGGSQMDYIDYIFVRAGSSGMWYKVQEQMSGYYPLRPYNSHMCTLYQRGVFGYVGYWVRAASGLQQGYLAKNEYGSWDSQTVFPDSKAICSARQRYIENYTPVGYLNYNTTTSQYDYHVEKFELMEEPPSPIGLRKGFVWGSYGFILWSQFSWLLTAVYWEIQILEAWKRQRMLGMTAGVTTDILVANPAGFAVGDTVTIAGAMKISGGSVVAFEELNDFIGDVTAVNPGAGTITVNLDSSLFDPYAGGGYVDLIVVEKELGDGVNPVQTFYEVESVDGLVIGTLYEWRCRCKDIRGEVSNWSDYNTDNRPTFMCVDEPVINTPSVAEGLTSKFPYVRFTTKEYRSPITKIETVIKTDPGGVVVHEQENTGSSARVQNEEYRVLIDITSELLTATDYVAEVTITNRKGYSGTGTSGTFALTFAGIADPTNLVLSEKDGYIKLSWTKPAGVTSYVIERDGEFLDILEDSSAVVNYFDGECRTNVPHTYVVKSYDGNTTSSGISGTITAGIDPFYAIVEKCYDKTVEPFAIKFGTDKNNLNFAFSNNTESVGSVAIPTFKTLEGVVRFETEKYIEFLEKGEERFYLKTKDRVIELLFSEMTEVQSSAVIRHGAVRKWLACSWSGKIL